MNFKRIISIILVLVWMIIVFSFSGQHGKSSGNMSRSVSGIVINIIDIGNKCTDIEKEKLIEVVEPMIRKLAHYILYTIGGIFIANCVFQFCKKEKKIILVSLIIGILYAVSDEVHQLIVIDRNGNIKDIIIDTLGIFTGIIFFLLLIKILAKIISNKEMGDKSGYRAN